MNSLTTVASNSSTNYGVVAPISMAFAAIAVVIASIILILVSLTKKLHTVTHLLICNTCLASILYCIVQCNNYIYLLFIKWDTSDRSCRWRAYFGYMSIVAVIYSYLLQAISRLFFSLRSVKYRWLISLKTHRILLIIKWIVVLFIPLPSLVTRDIIFRAGFLCWVPKKSMLHVAYTVIAYYLIPIVLIIMIYISIYIRVRHSTNNALVQDALARKRRQHRDLEVFRNIIILLGIYILGAIPSTLYILTGIEVFYSIGIVSVSFTVTIEKGVSILLDREIRNSLKKFVCPTRGQITPIGVNVIVIQKGVRVRVSETEITYSQPPLPSRRKKRSINDTERKKCNSFENKSQKYTSRKMEWRTNSVLLVCSLLLTPGLFLIIAGIKEIHKSLIYIKNDCQVIASDTVEYDCLERGLDCRYKPEWTVLYDRPNDNDQPIKAVIESLHLNTKSEAEATKKQMEYQVDQIYPCYHNPREHIVQWEQPSKRAGSLVLVCGFCLSLAAFAVLFLYLYISGLSDKKTDETRDEEQPKTDEVNDPLNPIVNT